MRLKDKDCSRTPATRMLGVLAWLAVAILTLQLLASATHNHALAEEHDDCVSCYLAAHSPPDMPSIALEILPAPLSPHSRFLPIPAYFFPATRSFLFPLSQAPPARP
jgi:hypothetical protein